jgi:hypothetical protein
MSARLIDRCGGCGSKYLTPVLSLGASPPTCVMAPVGSLPATEEHHPLELRQCRDCTLVQLSCIVDPEVVFPVDYPYSSGNSKALHEHFEDLADGAMEWMAPDDDLVVDIGANDGTLLSKFTDCRKVGVEPTGQADKIDCPSYRAFFSEDLAKRIRADHGPAKVITACNVLAHVADITDVMAGIRLLLADDGVLIAENHDLASITGSDWSTDLGGQWDTIYHEHLRFYSPFSFYNLLKTSGLEAIGWRTIQTHGGSFRMVCGKDPRTRCVAPPKINHGFKALARRAANARAGIRHATATGGIWGIGATARATTIINYCGLDVQDITCVCEVSGSDKIGRYIPGTRIPVVDEAELFEHRPNRALLFSWHLADVIVPKLRERGYDGEIIIPLPAVRSIRPERVAA